MASKEFEELSITEWKLSSEDGDAKVYRVFKNASEFDLVEAENATDAISKCGTQDVFMIKYGHVDNMDVVAKGLLSQIELPVEEAADEIAPEEAVAEAASEEAPAAQ